MAVNENEITSKNLYQALQSKVNDFSTRLAEAIEQNQQLSTELAAEKALIIAMEESKSKYTHFLKFFIFINNKFLHNSRTFFSVSNISNLDLIKRELGEEMQTLRWKLITLERNFDIQSAALEEEKLKSSTLVNSTNSTNSVISCYILLWTFFLY